MAEMDVSTTYIGTSCTLYFCLLCIAINLDMNMASNTLVDACDEAGIIFEKTDSEAIITVDINDVAVIPCKFEYQPPNETFNISDRKPVPFWRLQRYDSRPTFLYQGLFPPFYQYNGTDLIISKVDETLNDASIACCFEFINIRNICEANQTVIKINGSEFENTNTPQLKFNGALKPPNHHQLLIAVIILASITLVYS